MRRKTVCLTLLALVITAATAGLWGVEGDEHEGDTPTRIVAATGAPAGPDSDAAEGPDGAEAAEKPKKKGSRFGRFFKAPFKAMSRLFGGGGDDRKVARMTEKDGERFESAGVVRVEDSTAEKPPAPGPEGSARDHLDRGRALLEGGRLNEAVAELTRAASLDPRMSQAHSLLAVAYDRKGLRDRAKQSYERAIDLNETDAQALNNLGYSLYLSGNYRAAVDRLKRAAKLAPADARILNNLALAQCRLGKFDDAYKNFARAGGEFGGHMNVAALLERLGREEDAARHYEKARQLQPNSTGALRRLVELYERTGRRSEADSTRRALEAAEQGGEPSAVAGGR